MQKSGRNNPCPSCGRVKDADCRWTDDVIFCHQGSSHGPDPNLKISDVIDIDGTPWALVKTGSGYDNQAHVFKPHTARSTTTAVNRPNLLDHQAKRSIAVVALERFFTAHERAWQLGDFHQMTLDQLREAITVIHAAQDIGAELAVSVQRIWREHPDLAHLHRQRFEACLPSTKAMVADLAHFRSHYLGESPAEAWG